MPEKIIRAVGYFRMSGDRQEASIPDQKAWVEKVSPKERLHIVRAFEDHGIPGSEIDQRPDFQALLTFCEQCFAQGNPIEAIVNWDGDRFSRANSIRTAAVLDRLMEAGVTRMFSADGWIDWTNDMDRVLFNLKQDLAREGYSKAISRNVSRSCLSRVERGWWVSGRPPYGYRIHFVPAPDGKSRPIATHLELGDLIEVETVRWIFLTYATTSMSLGDLARALTERGAPPPQPRGRKQPGKPETRWKRITVRNILCNPVYQGMLVWNRRSQGKYHQVVEGQSQPVKHAGRRRDVRTEAKDRILVENAHPALVDAETFERCQRKLRENRWRRTTPIAGGGDWVLSGLVYCGVCDQRMGGRTSETRKPTGQRYRYRKYVCRANARYGAGCCRGCAAGQDMILEEVARQLKERFAPERFADLEREFERLATAGGRQTAQARTRLQAQLKKLARQIHQGNQNLALLPADRIPGVVATIRQWEEEHQARQRELEELDAVAEVSAEYLAENRAALAKLADLETLIRTRPPAEVRDLLSVTVEKVTLHFAPPVVWADGRQRNVLEEIEVEFKPGLSHLFSSSCRTQQVSLKLRFPVQRRAS